MNRNLIELFIYLAILCMWLISNTEALIDRDTAWCWLGSMWLILICYNLTNTIGRIGKVEK